MFFGTPELVQYYRIFWYEVAEAEGRLLESLVPAGADILDLSCEGQWLPVFLMDKANSVVAMGTHPLFLQELSEAIADSPHAGRVSIQRVRSLATVDSDRQFDVITLGVNSVSCISSDDERAVLFAQVRRLLKTDGRFFMTFHGLGMKAGTGHQERTNPGRSDEVHAMNADAVFDPFSGVRTINFRYETRRKGEVVRAVSTTEASRYMSFREIRTYLELAGFIVEETIPVYPEVLVCLACRKR